MANRHTTKSAGTKIFSGANRLFILIVVFILLPLTFSIQDFAAPVYAAEFGTRHKPGDDIPSTIPKRFTANKASLQNITCNLLQEIFRDQIIRLCLTPAHPAYDLKKLQGQIVDYLSKKLQQNRGQVFVSSQIHETNSSIPQALPQWFVPLVTSAVILAAVAIIFVILLSSSIKRKTHALQESEKRFRDVVMNINDWFWETDKQGLITYSSDQSETLLGYTPQDLQGSSMSGMLAENQPENTGPRLDNLFKSNSAFRQVHQIFRHKDGRSIHLALSGIAIYDKNRIATGFRGVATDISTQYLAETEKKVLEERLAQSQKMEAVGTLAGGIAHDFNNILTAILGYGELAREESLPGSPLAVYLREITQSGLRAKELVNQILTFSRRAELSATPLRPAHIIREAMRMLRPSLPVTIEIRQIVEDNGDCVFANPAQLNQVVINLATNAFHAMEEKGGILGITLRKVNFSISKQEGDLSIRPGTYFLLSVSDSGHGIPPQIKDKIFDPYFTTKKHGKGTGMGLAIVHGVVRDLKGYINCESEIGRGTTFNVYLPIIKRQSQDTALDDEPIPTGSERILCVDDEKMIVEMLQVLLRNLGYEVLTTTDSRQALSIVREDPDNFDLVITDQTMPKLTGEELASQLLTIRPNLPIILCTGFSSQLTEDKIKKIGVKELVHKPLVKKELAILIRKVLDERPQSTGEL